MISLALPTYNGEKYIEEQLDSIYSQTMLPDEIIVVDDCSTDRTVEILERYKQNYGLKYYVNEKNLGYNRNFEKAISLCNGDYITLCDQDDVWLPTKIEKSYLAISKYPCNTPALVSSFSSTDARILGNWKGKAIKGGDWKLNFTIHSSQGCTLMFNKKLKEIALPLPHGMMYDAYLGFMASLLGNRYYIGEQLMYYRIHRNNSLVKNQRESFFQSLYRNLHKHIPLWYDFNRYDTINNILNRFSDQVLPDRLLYINNILSLYKVSKFKRIRVFANIKEIPLRIRICSIALLVLKIVFGISDTD